MHFTKGSVFFLELILYYFLLPASVNSVIYNFVRFIYLSKAPNLSSSHSFKQQKRPKKGNIKELQCSHKAAASSVNKTETSSKNRELSEV